MGLESLYENGGMPISGALQNFLQAKQQTQVRQLMPDAINGDQSALSQLMSVDPNTGIKVGQIVQQRQLQQRAFQNQQIVGMNAGKAITGDWNDPDTQKAFTAIASVNPDFASKIQQQRSLHDFQKEKVAAENAPVYGQPTFSEDPNRPGSYVSTQVRTRGTTGDPTVLNPMPIGWKPPQKADGNQGVWISGTRHNPETNKDEIYYRNNKTNEEKTYGETPVAKPGGAAVSDNRVALSPDDPNSEYLPKDYLAPEDSLVFNKAISYAQGKAPLFAINSRTSPIEVAAQREAYKLNPHLSPQANKDYANAEKLYGEGGSEARVIKSANNFSQHAQLALKLYDALDNPDTRAGNAQINWLVKQYGDPRVNNAEQLATVLGAEFQKTFLPTGGIGDERKEQKMNFPVNGSRSEQRDSIRNALNIVSANMGSTEQGYRRAYPSNPWYPNGQDDFKERFFVPESRAALFGEKAPANPVIESLLQNPTKERRDAFDKAFYPGAANKYIRLNQR